MGWVDYPGVHLFAIGGSYPSFFHFAHGQLVENFLIFERKFDSFSRRDIHRVNLIGLQHGMAFGNQLSLFSQRHRDIIVDTFGNRLYFFCRSVCHEKLRFGFHTGDKEQGFAVGIPDEGIGIVIEFFGYIGFFFRLQIHNEKAVFVRLVSFAFHTLPGNVFSVGRKLRIGVVTRHAFRNVDGFAGFRMIQIDVGIGG